MISFKPGMNNEKIAMIALVIIIAGALSLFLISSFGGDIIDNLFDDTTTPNQGDNVIEEGDCADVNYIGRYATNNTVFDSSYDDVDEKTGGNPLNIFVTTDKTLPSPTGYSNYTSGFIDGLLSRLIGKEEGETYTLEIPPDEAYGNKMSGGELIHTEALNQNILYTNSFLNQSLEVVSVNTTNIILKWVDPPTEKFTMPSTIIYGSLDLQNPDVDYSDAVLMAPPFGLWENSTEIVDTTEDSFIMKTIPPKTSNLTDKPTQIPLDLLSGETLFIFPDATTVDYNEENGTITFMSNPTEGKTYSYSEQSIYGTLNIELTVNEVTSDKINVSSLYVDYNQTQNFEVDRIKTYNDTFEYPRIYNFDISFLQQALSYMIPDFQREGYSFDELAGETLIFEVTIENVYKTSS